MRLLELDQAGHIRLTSEWPAHEIPQYAILSHMWGEDSGEVTFKDITSGTGTDKPGYEKIRFCSRQAEGDGLRYFWVDTCCIDKSSSTELSEAINSMFRWYSKAAKCYVFLSDVPQAVSGHGNGSNRDTLEDDFRKSRWFRRGWTLQELLAPASVEFFSSDGRKIGTRTSLELQICDITRIPLKALRGNPITEFPVKERFLWQDGRETKKEEDLVYSLLGIFNVSLPVIYGEGRDKARRRLESEVSIALKVTNIGTQHEDFSIPFGLTDIVGVEHFVARSNDLQEIRKALSSDGSRRTVVLHGLGGIGKTQLALAYATRHKDSYSAVFWLNIKDKDTVKLSFANIAKRILRTHPSANSLGGVDTGENLDEIVEGVKAWLSLPNNTRWLMIYDNYDNPKVPGSADLTAVNIRSFLPEAYQGSVVITTRSPQVNLGHRIEIRKLDELQDSVKILSNSSRRGELLDDPGAVSLANKLDGLPLALATAGAYLDQTPISFTEYLHHYEVSWAKLQETSPGLMSYEDRTLFSTWQISFDQVKQRNPIAANLLCLWAYFDNQDLWFELLCHSNIEDPEWIRKLTEDELEFHNSIRVLCNHGLVEANSSAAEGIPESRGYSIHACVHSWTKAVLNSKFNWDLARLAMRYVASHVPKSSSAKRWLVQRRLLNHASICLHTFETDRYAGNNSPWQYHQLGMLFADQGKLNEAEKMHERALQGYEKALGKDHISTLNIVNNLGALYTNQGKLNQAEKMFERALEGYEKALGKDDISALGIVNNLGALYTYQGKLDKAEKMYERALQGKEKALGKDHMSTFDIVNNLGALYASQGKLNQAEKMFERVLQGYEKALGKDDISALGIVNNLGVLYVDQGKLNEAEKIYERALQGSETALGKDHISTLDTLNNLGGLYVDQGKLDQAEKMHERALQGYEKALGKDHILTLNTVNSLGILYARQEKLDQADKMFERALQGYEKALGKDHMSTLDTVNNLGNLYARQGKLDQAEKMFERALQGYEKALGKDHMSTLITVNNLGNFYARYGKLDKAKKMYERALQGTEKALGKDHTSMLETVNNLGNLYAYQGELDKAEDMYERALQGKEKALGKDHISTLSTVNNLGAFYARQGKLDEAEEMYERALQGTEKALGKDHISTLQILNNLGNLYDRHGKPDEAEETYERTQMG